MFRVVFGLILSSFFGLFVFIAFASIASDITNGGEVDERGVGSILVGSFVFAGVPGWLLCYSGGQSLKRKKVIKASLDMLEDNNFIDIAKISFRTGRNKTKTIKDIEVGQREGIIPNNAEIIRDYKAVESEGINKEYAEMSDTLLAPASEVVDYQVENIENAEDIEEVENIENQEVIIEATELAIKIQRDAPNAFTKGSDKEVSIYNGISYYFRIEQLHSKIASYVGNRVLISRNDYTINDGRLLKVDITNDFKIIEVYYSDIFEGNIISMKELLKSYQNK